MSIFWQIILKRFLRAFVAGAIASMLLVAPVGTSDWKELYSWISALALSGIFGGVTGILMALDKMFRLEDT